MNQNDRPVVLITGATRGIGLAIAKALRHTHHVLVGGRNPDAVQGICAQLPCAAPFVCDLTDTASIARACEKVKRVDVLVHCAGVARFPKIADAEPADWEYTFTVNVFAVAELTRLLLPKLRESAGLVVTINSGAGFQSGPGAAVYAGSKFALRAFTDALRLEERGKVRVSSVHPGRVATDMQEEIWAELGVADQYNPADHMPVDAVAAAVVAVVTAGPNAVINELSINPPVQRNPR